MPKPLKNKIIENSNIIIVDSNEKLVSDYSAILESKGHKTFACKELDESLEIVSSNQIDLLLLSYSLVEDSLDEAINRIRAVSTRIRIIILFDDTHTVSRHDILESLPVHGCHDKSEGNEKLLIWINTVLKVLTIRDLLHEGIGTIKSQVKIIEKNKEGLRYIINAMPDTVSRLQPLDKFIRGILIQLNGFIEADNSFFASIDDNGQLILLVGTGEFDVDEKTFIHSDALKQRMDKIEELKSTRQPVTIDREAFFPLNVKDDIVGVFYVQRNSRELQDLEIEMLRLFASQAAVTIENSNLFKLATIDGLTGLYVRRYFMQRFQEVLQFSSRYGGQAISLLLFDIDHFKYINDTFGHPEGDRVLARVSEIIRTSIRQTDITGRIGGEEFCVLLIDTELTKAQDMAENIREKVESEEFILGEGRHPVTISIGVSNFPSYVIDPDRLKEKSLSDVVKHDLRRLLAETDKALYQSKENGRNRVSVGKILSAD